MNWHLKRFNELTINEIYEILRLRNEVFVVEQTCAYQECDGKDINSYHLYSEENGQIISYLRIIEKGVSYDEVSIGRVLVRKNYRGQGISREMMLKAIKFIEQTLSEEEIRIQAQAYLAEFYKSFGFNEISAEYLEDGIPHIDMLYKKVRG